MKYKVTLNNKVYEVEVEKGEAMLLDEYEALAPVAAAAPAAPAAPVAAPVPAAPAGAADGEPVNSPLPGSIFDIKVKAGDAVKSGDVLIIIEAMKMENEVMAGRDGRVKSVVVNKGDTVETGSLLLTLE